MEQIKTGGETAKAPLPSITGNTGRVQLRPVLLAGGFLLLFFGVVGLMLSLKPFADSPPSGKPELDVFAAGPAKEFPPGTVAYFQDEHVYLVRFADGAFLALYDLSPATQAFVHDNDMTKLACRAVLTQGDEVAGHLGRDIGERGFPSTAFVDSCSGAVWDAEGTHVGGPSDGRLDRFPVAIINDIVRIDLADRRCEDVRNPCIPTQ